ncbi:MAG: hypothetical protein U0V87_06805 [Acidobacteriota bacterium]
MRWNLQLSIALAALFLACLPAHCLPRSRPLWDELVEVDAMVLAEPIAYAIHEGLSYIPFEPQIGSDGLSRVPEDPQKTASSSRSSRRSGHLRITARISEVLFGAKLGLQPGDSIVVPEDYSFEKGLPTRRGTYTIRAYPGGNSVRQYDDHCRSNSCRLQFDEFVRRAAEILDAPVISPRRIAEWGLAVAEDPELWPFGLHVFAHEGVATQIIPTSTRAKREFKTEKLFPLLTAKEVDRLVAIALKAGPQSSRFRVTINLPFEALPAELQGSACRGIEAILRSGNNLEAVRPLIAALLQARSDRRSEVTEQLSSTAHVIRSARLLWSRVSELQWPPERNPVLLRHLWAGLIREGWIADGGYELDWWQPRLAAAAYDHLARIDATRAHAYDEWSYADPPPDEWESNWIPVEDRPSETVFDDLDGPFP